VIVTRVKRTKKKRRGVFYTPDSVTDALCQWVVRCKDDVVLEPSFGGCGFIESLRKRFAQLGKEYPTGSVFGCDIDPTAFAHLRNSSIPLATLGHFIKGDFLKMSAGTFGVRGFDAVVGNPPYVSYHNMYEVQRGVALEIGKGGPFELGRGSSLWAYFVVHGLTFLKGGGRAAWVLPGSLLQANYGKELLHRLAPHFERVMVISLSQRLFLSEGTDESTEILLCDGWNCGPAINGVEVRSAPNVDTCQQFISSWRDQSLRGSSLNGRAVLTMLTDDTLTEYHGIARHTEVKKLGDLATILIGIVTGANHFFVMNRTRARQAKIPFVSLSLILSKFRFAPSLILSESDMLIAYKDDQNCLLISRPCLGRAALSVRRYFDAFPKALIDTNATFSKRGVWHEPDDGKIPDAFLPYMNHLGPRLVLNSALVNSTNTIHRVYFDPLTTPIQRKLVTISMLSSFSQLSAEIEGRTYGSGVLKHEPSEAARIKLIVPTTNDKRYVESVFSRIEACLRDGQHREASEHSDIMLARLEPQLMNRQKVHKLRLAIEQLRGRRYF
jgi:adenine-specific DNA-methyltransferase